MPKTMDSKVGQFLGSLPLTSLAVGQVLSEDSVNDLIITDIWEDKEDARDVA